MRVQTPAEMTQRERMLSGLPYEAWDPELVRMRHRARRLLREHNATTEVFLLAIYFVYFLKKEKCK